MTEIANLHFHDEDAARAHLERIRWPNGPVCPFCGGTDKIAAYGPSMGAGWYQCGDCREKFTVRVGTVYERSHIPLHKWVYATYLMNASKKGISAKQLERMLKITYKSAWFMAHRIRESMSPASLPPMGGEGSTVEMDETYYGKLETPHVSKQRKDRPYTKKGKAAGRTKRAIVSLVERGGNVRSFHVALADKQTVTQIISENIKAGTALHTDESRLYNEAAKHVASHTRVKHSAGEYVRREGERVIHTNTIEGYFSIFKRGMKGVYQHCKEKHLQRYLTEFDFRYNNREAVGISDEMRAVAAHKGAVGKRLTYRRTGRSA